MAAVLCFGHEGIVRVGRRAAGAVDHGLTCEVRGVAEGWESACAETKARDADSE